MFAQIVWHRSAWRATHYCNSNLTVQLSPYNAYIGIHRGYSRTPGQTEVTLKRYLYDHEELTRKAKTEEMQKSIVTNLCFGPDKSGRHHMHDGRSKQGCCQIGSMLHDTNTSCMSKHDLQTKQYTGRASHMFLTSAFLARLSAVRNLRTCQLQETTVTLRLHTHKNLLTATCIMTRCF